MTSKPDTAENKECRHPAHPRAAVSIHNILCGWWLNGRRSSSSSDNRRPTNIKTIIQRGRAHTNSYGEEVAAATMASSYAPTANPSAQRCITFQWIPDHAAIPGNELADATAKATTSLDEPQAPASYGSACKLIRSQLKDAASQHRVIKAIYTTTTKK